MDNNYALIKEKMIQNLEVLPSLLSLKVAFDLKFHDLAAQFLNYDQVVQEISFNIDSLSQDPLLLAYICEKLAFSETYYQIKKDYLHLENVWEKIVELEGIVTSIQGSYFTGENQALIKQDNLKEADIILDNKDHPVISSLNKLSIKQEFKFSAKLQKGSLFTYIGSIDLAEQDEKLHLILNQESQKLSLHNQFKSILKGATGVSLALGMTIALTGCGVNPYGNGEPPPSSNSIDCVVRRTAFYDKLGDLKANMTEEEIDNILDPNRRMRKGSFKYSTSYEIEGYDYSVPGVVTCEAVQIHYDSNWRFRSFAIKSYPL